MSNFNPSPGVVIIEPIEKDSSSSVTLTEVAKTRLIKGKILAVGRNLITDGGALIETDWFAAVGDIVYFLTYEGDYDNFYYENKRYYAVKVQDLRTRI